MRVRFWGTRGSLPGAPEGEAIRQKIKRALLKASGRKFETEMSVEQFIDAELDFPTRHGYGGNSSCVEISGGANSTVCDMGSGLRCFGQQVMKAHGPTRAQVYNFFMSHVHWDHIMGFPFFPPAYIPGNTIRIHGCHKAMRDVFIRQQSDPCFPIDFRKLGATIEFVELEPGRTYEIDGLSVKAIRQNHPSDSYGFRFWKN